MGCGWDIYVGGGSGGLDFILSLAELGFSLGPCWGQGGRDGHLLAALNKSI